MNTFPGGICVVLEIQTATALNLVTATLFRQPGLKYAGSVDRPLFAVGHHTSQIFEGLILPLAVILEQCSLAT
jgi:hypothetical protein